MGDPGYPRPGMERSLWVSLDGPWEFEFDPSGGRFPEKWLARDSLERSIQVPFCVESEAGGIDEKRPLPDFWYAKNFPASILPRGSRQFLHFGAVDYEAEAWLNGTRLGAHRGGYDPFTFEITRHLATENRLLLRVRDARLKHTLRGKQLVREKLSPIFYTTVSGIWQPVFIYSTGSSRIRSLRVSASMDRIDLAWNIDTESGCALRLTILDPSGGTVVRENVDNPMKRESASFAVPDPRHWSPEDPALYTVRLELDDDGGVSDSVTTRTGLRRIETVDGRFLLNGSPLQLRMLLLQGYYPGGHYTPVDGARSFERDILAIMGMGFNGVRVHQKIEDPRFIDLCDRHGLLVWEEIPSPFLFGRLREEEYEEELFAILERDYGRPSVMAAVLFNETWGIYDLLWSKKRRNYLRGLYGRVKAFNPDLLVVDNSGFDHVVTDIADIHHYLTDERKIRALYRSLGDRGRMTTRFFKLLRAAAYLLWTHRVARRPYLRGGEWRGHEPFVVSEFGGAGHYRSEMGMLESLAFNLRIMARYPAIAGYCLTQAYDVEGERNGLMTIDREMKFPAEEIRGLIMNGITLRAFDEREHLPLVNEWLRKKHVFKWWKVESLNASDYSPVPGGGHAVIHCGAVPVGYIRWNMLSDEEREAAGVPEQAAAVIDIDLFIGEEKRLGRGIGPQALEILFKRLSEERGGMMAGLCTSVLNHSAMRSFEKAGFRKWRRFDDERHGACWLMVRDSR